MKRPAARVERVVATIEGQRWLDLPSFKIEHAMATAFNLLGAAGPGVRSFLHGTWLGHPLHPMLTDVPVGAWTATAALDVLGSLPTRSRASSNASAQFTLGVGLAGAVGAAVAGATDWQYTEGDARRVGLAHGAVNAAALGCYAASLRQRRRGRQAGGRLLGWVGYGLVLSGSYLGGVLTFRHRVGVDHTDDALRPRAFVSVLPLDELRQEEPQLVEAEGMRVVLVRRGDEIAAFGDQCPHQGGPLSEGFLDGELLVCPWHGSRFDLQDGQPARGPATTGLSCFEVRVQDGQLQVRRRAPVASAPPGSVLARRQADDDARD